MVRVFGDRFGLIRLVVLPLSVLLGAAFFVSCAQQVTPPVDTPELFGLSQDYLVFNTEVEAEQASDYMFAAGYEIEVEQGTYDVNPVFLIQIPQFPDMSTEEFLNLEDEGGEHFFPEEYIDSAIEFVMYF